MKVLWMEVTKDKYELPVAVADTQGELAEMRGTTKDRIKSCYSKYKLEITKECKYRRVEVEE